MGNRFLMALYRASEALLDQTFMQRWGKLFQKIQGVPLKAPLRVSGEP
jgi:hypothetical protein